MPGSVPDVRLSGVRKTYGDVVAVDRVDLEIARGEFFTMLGPVGLGQDDDAADDRRLRAARRGHGRARRRGRHRRSPPYDRDVNTVFQDYALFPHMTVGDNVEYGLRVAQGRQGRARARAAPRRSRWSACPATTTASRAELSGGQRQRVALARAIVNRPRVLLLDEPLGALDLKLREQMQIELKQIQREVGITFVYVTHDQDEALTMCDRIAVFNEGRIEQIGDARRASTSARPTRSSPASSASRTCSSATAAASRSARRRSGCSRRASPPTGCTSRRARSPTSPTPGMVTRFHGRARRRRSAPGRPAEPRDRPHDEAREHARAARSESAGGREHTVAVAERRSRNQQRRTA